MNFLELLIEKHRMPVIFRIRREYDAHVGATRTSSCPSRSPRPSSSTSETVKGIGERIGEQTGQQGRAHRHASTPTILGGIVLRVGNSILDASIRNRLERLRQQVAKGTA